MEIGIIVLSFDFKITLFVEKLVISTPVCVHYGEFNTGKTTLLQCLSAMHGIRNGKVHCKLLIFVYRVNI